MLARNAVPQHTEMADINDTYLPVRQRRGFPTIAVRPFNPFQHFEFIDLREELFVFDKRSNQSNDCTWRVIWHVVLERSIMTAAPQRIWLEVGRMYGRRGAVWEEHSAQKVDH